MTKQEIIDNINARTIPTSYYDEVCDRESFIKGYLCALLHTYEITYEEYEEILEELEK